MRTLTASQARRIALAAQGFTDPRPSGRVDIRHLRRVMGRIGALQIDSVNVLERAHYLPLFSRIGAYPRELLDDAAYRRRDLFEYWGHAASFLPVEAYPLLRHRMDTWQPWPRMQRLADEDPGYIESVASEVAARGPLSAGELSEPGTTSGPWWGWSKGKTALEWLFCRGRITVHDRVAFTRRYDLTERVLPPRVLDAPVPEPEAARRALLLSAARALGVATVKHLADYYRQDGGTTRRLAETLTAEGALERVRVQGWERPAYLDPGATLPRKVEAAVLLNPFDPLIWHRSRVAQLFGFHYRIEIYVPAPQRRYGYYVLPFLLGDRLVARVDLKADRPHGRLLVQAAWHEPDVVARDVVAPLRAALVGLAEWLELDHLVVRDHGDLAADLAACQAGEGSGRTTSPRLHRGHGVHWGRRHGRAGERHGGRSAG